MIDLIATQITLPDLITFLVAGIAVVLGALGVVLMRNPVHSALSMIMTLFAVAVLFIEQDAQFLAAVQVIVYAGAIVVLFLFVIMLLGVDKKEYLGKDKLRGQRPLAFVSVLIIFVEILTLAKGNWATGAKATVMSTTSPISNVEQLARAIFTTYLLPFEATSVLLIVAVVGAVVLVRRVDEKPGEAEQPKELETESEMK
ncbi:MAG: NADH-quinone oxidoreductase subunit J [Actinomycetota bacterium]|jgi:NADH-quinone oxidoreductase subunit J|nr:NADH-quinone oxidoreductase subunit J [Actinomycetota bacterium]